MFPKAKNHTAFTSLLVFVWLLFVHAPVWAQIGSGTISGTVTDASGAVVVGASVSVKNTQTGVVTPAVTNLQGRYAAPDLNVGEYDVQAQMQGFQTQVRSGIALTVGREVVVDLSLSVGQKTESVTVEAEIPQIDTTTSEQSALIGQQQMRELPLNGRNFEQLILLAPGVQPVTTGSQNSFYGREASYSIAGSRPEGQQLLLDGANIQGFWNHGAGNSIIGTSLGVEAIGEFQVLTNTYSARFGGSGSVMNATTRSGTNRFHGSAYDFLRNSVLDARNFFNTPVFPKDSFRRNQFGGILGGPAKKDKMFFFVNYEGIRQQLGLTTLPTVPNANARQGFLPCSAAPGIPCDPITNLANVGVNPAVQAALNVFPPLTPAAQEIGGGVATDVARGFEPAHEDYVNTRWDFAVSSSDSIFARYVFDNGNLTDPFASPFGLSSFGLFPEQSQGRNQYLTIGERKVFTSSLVNDARFTFVRTRMTAFTTANFPALDFFPGENRQNGVVNIAGLSPLGPSAFTPDFEIQNSYSAADDVFWTHGNHTFEFGVEFRRQQSNLANGFFSAGTWTFPSLLSFLQDQPVIFLGALPGRANSYRGFRESDLFPYVQDTWKVKPTLTLNFGLRYDFISNPVEVNGQLCAFVSPADPAETGCTNVSNVFARNPSLKSLDPRGGFAWDPFKDHKTSIRAGGGIFHNPIHVRVYHPAYLFASPYQTAVQPCLPFLPCTFPIPFQGLVVPIPTIGVGLGYQADTTPFVAQYNFGIQRELFAGTVLNVAYIGSRGVNLLVERDSNPPIPNIVNRQKNFAGGPSIGRSTPRLNPNLAALVFSMPDAPSWYNSLQVYLTRNLSKNVQFQAAYTYSKCIDQGSESYGLEGHNGAAPSQLDPYDQAPERGLCNFDFRHSFIANAVYTFPFHGNAFVQGWQFSTIAAAHSGTPFTLADGFDRADLNNPAGVGGAERPDLVPGRSNNPIVGKVNQWYDPSAFSLQAPGALGNLGRNTLIGPKFVNFDMSLAKNTKIREKLNVQFRVEAFNIFNHPNFGLPDFTLYTGPACPGRTPPNTNCPGPGIPNSHAGVISNTVSTSRQLQFAVKLVF